MIIKKVYVLILNKIYTHIITLVNIFFDNNLKFQLTQPQKVVYFTTITNTLLHRTNCLLK